MRFGDINTFGVDLELDENHGGAWLYGKLCYWINGSQVGDFDLGTSLRDAYFQMKWLVHDRGNRDGGLLCTLPNHDVFFQLDSFLYDSEQDVKHQGIETPESPARFEVKIPIDVFDDWKIYLIQCGNVATILYKNINRGDLASFVMPGDLFDSVIRESYAYLQSLYEKECGQELCRS